MQTITPTEHDKHEWSRLAQNAYATGRNAIGHRYSGAAALRIGQALPIAQFDSIQSDYRAWLIDGIDAAFPKFDCPLCGQHISDGKPCGCGAR